ncbi:hypothetical protein Ocin01_11811 [Orchesella cincta]|uniref:Ninjurin-1 n=1 Tax=Orchesella cincta TaxID=48709 RepID=A0A1D2MPY3_ORCCI|nr:hypothetical protein Ocin01_11811 [Orchesella cincta]
MKSFHDYATLKTTGQLVMDLGSISTHICALVALLRNYDVHNNLSTKVLLWVLVGTIIFQVIVAVGLYIFRTLDLNSEVNHQAANRWNIVFFCALFLVAVLETFIGAFEKFGMDHVPYISGNGTSVF